MCDPSSSNTHTVLCASTPQVLIGIEAVAPKKAAAKFSDALRTCDGTIFFGLYTPLELYTPSLANFFGNNLLAPRSLFPKSFPVQTITPWLLPWLWPLPCTLVRLSLRDSILGLPWPWHPWRSPVCAQVLAKVCSWAAQAWPQADIATKPHHLKGNRVIMPPSTSTHNRHQHASCDTPSSGFPLPWACSSWLAPALDVSECFPSSEIHN